MIVVFPPPDRPTSAVFFPHAIFIEKSLRTDHWFWYENPIFLSS